MFDTFKYIFFVRMTVFLLFYIDYIFSWLIIFPVLFINVLRDYLNLYIIIILFIFIRMFIFFFI